MFSKSFVSLFIIALTSVNAAAIPISERDSADLRVPKLSVPKLPSLPKVPSIVSDLAPVVAGGLIGQLTGVFDNKASATETASATATDTGLASATNTVTPTATDPGLAAATASAAATTAAASLAPISG